MRYLLFGAAVIVGMGFAGSGPAAAAPLTISGLSSQSANVAAVEKIGWRRQYRRYGYPVPYAYYYPPAYGYYAPPPAYAYAPPAYDSYAPPPAVAEGDYSPADGDYGEYPENGEYPANGEYGEYPPANGY